MQPDDRRLYQGQFYWLVGYRPHVCRDGREIELEIWRSRCAECGEEFDFGWPINSKKPFGPSRRCAEHKAPGHRVARGRPRPPRRGVTHDPDPIIHPFKSHA